MDSVVVSLWFLGETLVTITLLALAASFSPILYLSQAKVASNPQEAHRTWAIGVGVVGAVGLLLITFQFLSLETLLSLVESTTSALLLNTITYMFVGSVCIYAGLRYRLSTDVDRARPQPSYSPAGLVGFGFSKTALSVSGLTATFLAGNLVAHASSGIVTRVLFTAIFLFVSLVPFLWITHLISRDHARITQLVRRTSTYLRSPSYRSRAGSILIAVGVSIIVLRLAIAPLS